MPDSDRQNYLFWAPIYLHIIRLDSPSPAGYALGNGKGEHSSTIDAPGEPRTEVMRSRFIVHCLSFDLCGIILFPDDDTAKAYPLRTGGGRDGWKVYKLSVYSYLGLVFTLMCLDSWMRCLPEPVELEKGLVSRIEASLSEYIPVESSQPRLGYSWRG